MAAFPRIFREGTRSVHALEHPPGWHSLMRALLEQVNALLDDRQVEGFVLLQAKSKLAGLRFYWVLAVPQDASDATQALWERHVEEDEQTRALIRQAVQSACKQSGQTCERCGLMGALRNFDGFLVTLCTPCAVRAEAGERW
jgi:Na+-translocating ferredoxin:NAD+ oxidoreductase RNF subunit RnfB